MDSSYFKEQPYRKFYLLYITELVDILEDKKVKFYEKIKLKPRINIWHL